MELSPIPHPIYTVRLGNTVVPYTIRRSQRAKHIRITITQHNGVVVTFPARMRRYVNPDDFLREKEEWVLKHLERAGNPDPRPTSLAAGSKVNFGGRQYTLAVCNCSVRQPRVELAGEEMRLSLPVGFEGELKDVVKKWIQQKAADTITAEAEHQASAIGVQYNRVTIRDQKTKWGSCSKKGNLSFNWRLILFPPRVMRYIVIHELCHLRHFNHSHRFWEFVERHDPHYRESVAWLKQYGAEIEGALR